MADEGKPKEEYSETQIETPAGMRGLEDLIKQMYGGKVPLELFPMISPESSPDAISKLLDVMTPFGLVSTDTLLSILHKDLRKISSMVDPKVLLEILSKLFASSLVNFDIQSDHIKKLGKKLKIDEILKNLSEEFKRESILPDKHMKELENLGLKGLEKPEEIHARDLTYHLISSILSSYNEDKVAEYLNSMVRGMKDDREIRKYVIIVKDALKKISEGLGLSFPEDAYLPKGEKGIEGDYKFISKLREKMIQEFTKSLKEVEEADEWKEIVDFYKSL